MLKITLWKWLVAALVKIFLLVKIFSISHVCSEKKLKSSKVLPHKNHVSMLHFLCKDKIN